MDFPLYLTFDVLPCRGGSSRLCLKTDSPNEQSGIWVQRTAALGEKLSPFKPWNIPDGEKIYRSIPVGEEEVQLLSTILQLLEKIKTKVLPEWKRGRDGSYYQLELKGNTGSLVYRWWAKLPSEWNSLMPVVQQLSRYISNDHQKYPL